jgi:release factor glutamine methyltransferase
MNDRSWKLLDLLGEASGFFASREIESGRLQAELLLSAALGIRRLDLYLQFDKLLTPGEVEVFREFVRRRLKGEPVQYITGEAAFRMLELAVTDAVLIPRPETEILVEAALAFLSDHSEPQVLDPGCGSGAIGISIACEHPPARVTVTDIDPHALRVAHSNAARCDALESMRFVCGDLFEPLGEGARFDAIVCNPPYVRTADLTSLDEEVRDFEPHLALDGGEDGLAFFRRIAAPAAALLAADGCLFLEVGDDQADSVAGLLDQSGKYEVIEILPDLASVPRVVCGRCRIGRT